MLRGSWAVSGFAKALARGYIWIAQTLSALSENSDAWNGYTLRQHVASGGLPASGNYIRFSFKAGSSQGLTITNCYVGKRGSGDYDFATTPTQVFFNSGSAGATISAGATQYCDPVALSLSSTDSIVIAVYTAGGTGSDMYARHNVPGAGATFKTAYKLANDASTVTASGYTTQNFTILYLDDLEVSV